MLVVEGYPMSTPGPQEYISSLASVVPYYNSRLPPVAPHLRQLIDTCRPRWIREFLFNKDPTHLQIFSAPHYKQHAIACEISARRYQPPIVPAPYGLDFNSSVVFIPAFSVDEISVGFGIDEKSYTCDQSSVTLESPRNVTSEVKRNIDNFRYIRDDRRGILIMVYDYGEYFQLEFNVHQNTRTRSRSTSQFSREAFYNLLYSETELEEKTIICAVLCLQFVDEFRHCPNCGNSPDNHCDCVLPLSTARHSLDFSNHGAQMTLHSGKYQGMVHLTKYDQGEQKCVLSLGSSINIKCSMAPSLVNRLTDFVLSRDLPNYPFSVPVQTLASSSGPRLNTEPLPTSLFQVLHRGVSHGRQQGDTMVAMPMQEDDMITSNPEGIGSMPFQGLSHIHQDELHAGMTPAEIEVQRQREVKCERKKARNRLSAQRSNLKKKRENDERKAMLSMLRQRETELRSHEKILREENLRLREAVYGSIDPHRTLNIRTSLHLPVRDIS